MWQVREVRARILETASCWFVGCQPYVGNLRKAGVLAMSWVAGGFTAVQDLWNCLCLLDLATCWQSRGQGKFRGFFSWILVIERGECQDQEQVGRHRLLIGSTYLECV